MKMHPAWIVLIALGAAALVYNVFIAEGESISLENEIRIGFIVVIAIAGAYELWKRSSR